MISLVAAAAAAAASNRHQMNNDNSNQFHHEEMMHDVEDDEDNNVDYMDYDYDYNQFNYNHAHQSTYNLKGNRNSTITNNNINNNNNNNTSTRSNTTIATSNSTTSNNPSGALNSKQFQHVRHMNDVMRLAFLENNDISPEVWRNIDFNSSTASILRRNIQQQLNWNAATAHTSSPKQLNRSQSNGNTNSSLMQTNNIDDSSMRSNAKKIRRSLLSTKSSLPAHQHNRSSISNTNSTNQHRQQQNSLSNFQNRSTAQQLAAAVSASSKSRSGQYTAVSLHQQQQQRQNHLRNEISAVKQLQKQQQQHNLNTYQRLTTSSSSSSSSTNRNSQNSIHKTTTTTPSTPVVASSKPEPVGGEFPCDEPGCGKFFPSLRKLRHHKVVHSNDFPYSCQFKGCEKRFKRKFGIDLHSTTHFDLDSDMYTRTSNNSSMQIFGRRMQYSMCKQCDAKFKTVHEYQVHMLAHGKEPFKCPVKGCGQSFSIWKSFQKHRASHYFNYYCRMNDQCDHHTSNLQLLKLHIYCCHFNRKLPDNAKPTSRDQEAPSSNGAACVKAQLGRNSCEEEEEEEEEDEEEEEEDEVEEEEEEEAVVEGDEENHHQLKVEAADQDQGRLGGPLRNGCKKEPEEGGGGGGQVEVDDDEAETETEAEVGPEGEPIGREQQEEAAEGDQEVVRNDCAYLLKKVPTQGRGRAPASAQLVVTHARTRASTRVAAASRRK